MKFRVCSRQVNTYTYHVEAETPRDAYHKIKNASIDEKRNWVVDGKSRDEEVLEAEELKEEKNGNR